MFLYCKKEETKTPSMAHHQLQQHSATESEPLKLKKPHQPKKKWQGEEHEENTKASNVHKDKKEIALDNVEGEEDSGRERLKRHRIAVAGRVWIPEIWGQEELLKDWIDCKAFDAPLVPSSIVMARAALVQEGRRATTSGFGIENRC